MIVTQELKDAIKRLFDMGLIDMTTPIQRKNKNMEFLDPKTDVKYSFYNSGYYRKYLPTADRLAVMNSRTDPEEDKRFIRNRRDKFEFMIDRIIPKILKDRSKYMTKNAQLQDKIDQILEL